MRTDSPTSRTQEPERTCADCGATIDATQATTYYGRCGGCHAASTVPSPARFALRSVPAPTQREEWVVQQHLRGGAWGDVMILPRASSGPDGELWLSEIRRERHRDRFRLVHRVITESVIEEPS